MCFLSISDDRYKAFYFMKLILQAACGLIVTGVGAFTPNRHSIFGYILFGTFQIYSAGALIFIYLKVKIDLKKETNASSWYGFGICLFYLTVHFILQPKYINLIEISTVIFLVLIFLYGWWLLCCLYPNDLAYYASPEEVIEIKTSPPSAIHENINNEPVLLSVPNLEQIHRQNFQNVNKFESLV